MTNNTQNVTAKCYDCGTPYGEGGFSVDLLVPNEVWLKISPTGHDGGLLCPTCLVAAVVNAGLSGVPCYVVGPAMESVNRNEWLVICKHPDAIAAHSGRYREGAEDMREAIAQDFERRMQIFLGSLTESGLVDCANYEGTYRDIIRCIRAVPLPAGTDKDKSDD